MWETTSNIGWNNGTSEFYSGIKQFCIKFVLSAIDCEQRKHEDRYLKPKTVKYWTLWDQLWRNAQSPPCRMGRISNVKQNSFKQTNWCLEGPRIWIKKMLNSIISLKRKNTSQVDIVMTYVWGVGESRIKKTTSCKLNKTRQVDIYIICILLYSYRRISSYCK